MKVNYFLTISILIASMMFVSCNQTNSENGEKSEKDSKKTEQTSNDEGSSSDVSSKEMTEDIYIDIAAKQMYLTSKYAKMLAKKDVSEEKEKLMVEKSEEMEALYKDHGVTVDAYQEFQDELDRETGLELSRRVSERLKELELSEFSEK